MITLKKQIRKISESYFDIGRYNSLMGKWYLYLQVHCKLDI